MNLVEGVPIESPDVVWLTPTSLIGLDNNETAAKLLLSDSREERILSLTAADREAMLLALEDAPSRVEPFVTKASSRGAAVRGLRAVTVE